jgi:hypothetical protein
MMEYGRRSPIGSVSNIFLPIVRHLTRLTARQETLLQELMREIVRMTAQKQPLQVGVPLYPFSHKTLFSRDKAPVLSDESSGSAPLPINPSYDEQELLSHRSSRNSNSSWSQRGVSGSPGDFVL